MACILLADDSKEIRDTLRRIFLEEGFAFCVEAFSLLENADWSQGPEGSRLQSWTLHSRIAQPRGRKDSGLLRVGSYASLSPGRFSRAIRRAISLVVGPRVAVASHTNIEKRLSLWRLAAVIALLVLVPVIFLFLTHVLGETGDASEAAPIYKPWTPVEV